MKLKQLITALSLGFAAISASATPLDALTGNLNIKLVGLTTEANTAAGTNETTWGVGNITSISGTGGQQWFSGQSDGTYLYYMIYGIADQNIVFDQNTGKFSIYNIGATGGAADGQIHLDIYRSNKNLLELTSNFNASPGQRTGYDSFSLFAGMEKYLEVEFRAGKQLDNVAGGDNPDADERLATLVQTATSKTLPAAGEGQFFGDVVGGTARAQWDTNSLFGHDLDGKFTLSTNGRDFGSGTCTAAQVANNTCFTGLINDPIRAVKVPEPGSLALLGLGFAGLAGLRRRRAAK
ncbi:PEP-CTERM sorting domain-containing protein [Massilia consociata]|uniref:PEP-CTERM sorting domain-containing protein n=1 Tax=Massilia consociata TaxID=760117 RepID=A0ABV6FBZ2_9BURK